MNITIRNSKLLRNILCLPAVLLSLSACVYGGGYNDYEAGFSGNEYCDPYNEYDAYYGCDVEYGFANIGYGGGWHQDFYYPGFGFFLFDRGGNRFRMNDYYQGYWGNRRRDFFRTRFANRQFSGQRLRRFARNERRGARRAGRGIEGRGGRTDERLDNRRIRRDARRTERSQRDESGAGARAEERNVRRDARRNTGRNTERNARQDSRRNGDNRQARAERRDRRTQNTNTQNPAPSQAQAQVRKPRADRASKPKQSRAAKPRPAKARSQNRAERRSSGRRSSGRRDVTWKNIKPE